MSTDSGLRIQFHFKSSLLVDSQTLWSKITNFRLNYQIFCLLILGRIKILQHYFEEIALEAPVVGVTVEASGGDYYVVEKLQTHCPASLFA